ncbi:hypothetical protein DFQ01_1065 [Paenibacillus cellulosilyticus]|uniref:Uncharacterized protein n=1 Tax=Paenibacillus cellulosilyticus TaxID=375489 RepID=A0A2V2YVS5_9BACL|nr:hypothetical protein [Paenibacillus cellulosilyticus]PWW04724.1 hypothetical protein DFQ01_1065 [Paenibacillus cellulosilyticus]QKS45851.1 hypothetical protein HUB94_16435 [Paenibacillus cellulosilyticus]
MHQYPTASLNVDAVQQIQDLEHALSQSTGDNIILIAYAQDSDERSEVAQEE